MLKANGLTGAGSLLIRFTVLAGVVLLSAGCVERAGHVHRSGPSGSKSAEQRLLFDIDGMNCGNCERTISKAVARLDGVLDVQASYEERRLIVRIDPKRVAARTIESQITRLGYDAVYRRSLR